MPLGVFEFEKTEPENETLSTSGTVGLSSKSGTSTIALDASDARLLRMATATSPTITDKQTATATPPMMTAGVVMASLWGAA